MGPPHLMRIALDLRLAYQNITEGEDLVTAATFMSDNSTLVDARIVVVNNTLNSEVVPVNGSFCRIASLEVYRGRRLTIVISRNGFSLSERGTIEVI